MYTLEEDRDGEPITILHVRLTLEEEGHFLQDVNDAVDDGELTPDEASAIIDREFDLQSKCR